MSVCSSKVYRQERNKRCFRGSNIIPRGTVIRQIVKDQKVRSK